MKILVTGASGYLGSHIVRALLSENYEILILKRSFSDTERIKDLLHDLYAYDIDKCPIEMPFKEHHKIDAIIHTAICYGRKGEKITEIFKSNTVFPLCLLETAISYNTEIFINTDTSLPANLNPYSLSKAQIVEWGQYIAKEEKIKFVNIKLEHFYGPRDEHTKFTTYVIKNCLSNVLELKLTLGEQKRDFIHIDDVVSAYLILLKKATEQSEWFQEYKLGSGKAVTIREFVEIVHRLTRSRTKLIFGAIPYRKGELMYSEADISKLEALGWSPKISLEAGIQQVISMDKV